MQRSGRECTADKNRPAGLECRQMPVLACAASRIGPRMRRVRAIAALAVAALAVAVLAWAAVAAARFVWTAEPGEVREARRAVADGRYDDAGQAITRWLSAVPDAPEAHFLKGRVAVAMDRLSDAAFELKRAQALGLPRAELALLQALVATKVGRHAQAEPVLRRAFEEQHAPDRQVDEALAKVYLETYDLARSATVLQVWTRDFPDDPKPHVWWAEVHSRAGEQEKVADDYREALRRDSSLVRAHLGLAEELRKAHRNAEAATEYDACLALDPNNAAAHLGAGRNLMEYGDEAAAARHLERVMELDPKNAEPHKTLAAAATRRGDWAASLALLDRAIALDPYDVAVRHSRGLALSRLGRIDEARTEEAATASLRKDLDRLNAAQTRLITSPHDRNSQLQVTRWLFDHGQDQEGARWAQKILAEWPNDPEASRLLAGYHQRRGETGLANLYRVHASAGPETPSGGRPEDP